MSASLSDKAGRVLVLRNERVGAGEAHVHLAAEFLPAAKCTAVDFGNEDGARDFLQKAANVRQLYQSGLTSGLLKEADVEVGYEVVRVGGAEDDYFWRRLARSGPEVKQEGVKIGNEIDVE